MTDFVDCSWEEYELNLKEQYPEDYFRMKFMFGNLIMNELVKILSEKEKQQ